MMRAIEESGSRLNCRQAVAWAVVVLALGLPEAANAQFGDLLRRGAAMIPVPKAAPAPPPPGAARPAGADASGAMGLQEPTALPPLHRLGTDAVAVVEAVTPRAPVREMDYVFAKQTIALGPSGKLTLSYLSGCRTETITGGTVTVALGGSSVAGGRSQEKITPGCRAAHPVILASASEAGATVNRVTPFTAANWDERALKSAQPVFKWDAALGVSSMQVRDMDQEGSPVVWQAPIAGQEWVAYPPKSAPLAPGAPYKAEAMAGGVVVASALFSIDPGLDVADNLANRVVPLSRP